MLRRLRLTTRSLARNPGFSLGVAITLALGLGASTAIFVTVDAVMLRTLPFTEPDRLALVWETVTRDTVERRPLSFPDFLDYREQVESIDDLAAFDPNFYTWRKSNSAERIAGTAVTPNFFAVLGTTPLLGSGFSEARVDGQAQEVVLSHGLWRDAFGADPAVLGDTMTLNDRSRVIVGVMPADFMPLFDGAQLWSSLLDLREDARQSRGSRFLSAVARLQPEVSIEQVRSELASVAKGLEATYPDDNLHYGADLGSLREEVLGSFNAPLATLGVAVVLVLLVSCLNVGNLWVVWRRKRAPEYSVKRALGASSSELFRGHLHETMMLGLAGGVGGLAVAAALVPLLRERSPVALPEFISFDLGLRVVAFTTAVALLVGVLLAASAVRTFRNAHLISMGTGNRLLSGGRAQALLVVGQPALAMLLAVGAGLYLQSLDRLAAVDVGLANQDLVFANLLLPEPEVAADQDTADDRDVVGELIERVSAVPGVIAASVSSDTPLGGGSSATVVSQEGRVPRPTEPWAGGVRVYRHRVSEGFFETLGINLISGRPIDATDHEDALPVAVVSERLAEKLWGDDDPVGRRFKFGEPRRATQADDEIRWVTVVGVSQEVRYRSLIPDPNRPPEDPDVYFSLAQFGTRNLTVTVRSAVAPSVLAAPLSDALTEVERFAVLIGTESLAERITAEVSRLRFTSWLLSLFALLVFVLAGVGIYGVLSQQILARTREIGLRVALGSTTRRVVSTVLGGSMRLVLIGVATGAVLALALERLVAAQLYGMETFSVPVYLIAAASCLVIGLLAGALPVLRAGRVSPMEALREE